jgi:CYTH domain-containing protein
MTPERSPGEGKYAKMEREQRWLLPSVPETAVFRAEIADYYFVSTSLRLRKVTAGSATTLKLTQKVRVDEGKPEFIKITNLYLTSPEFEMLSRLPTLTLLKHRYDFGEGQSTFAVDSFGGRHRGLDLAEIEINADEQRVLGPSSALTEVTDDNRFSGGYLAGASDNELTELLAECSSKIT